MLRKTHSLSLSHPAQPNTSWRDVGSRESSLSTAIVNEREYPPKTAFSFIGGSLSPSPLFTSNLLAGLGESVIAANRNEKKLF